MSYSDETTPAMERDWPTEIREWADTELPATETFLLEVADAFQELAEARNFFRRDRDLLVLHNESLANHNEEIERLSKVVVERYGRVWAKDIDYYRAAEALGIREPPDTSSEGGGNREHLSSAKAAAAPSPECPTNAFGSTVHEFPSAILGTKCLCGQVTWEGGLTDA